MRNQCTPIRMAAIGNVNNTDENVRNEKTNTFERDVNS